MTLRPASKISSGLSHGFTLIEVLVAIALGVIVLFAATNLLIATSHSSTDLQSRNELMAESQIAQNYMAWRLKEAAYVFPNLPGRSIKLGNTGYTTMNPISKNGTWALDDPDAPILAMILPPEQLLAGSAVDCPTECYQFIAYYPVKRSVWASGSSGSNYPGADPNNADRWVLVEYRKNFAPATASIPPVVPVPLMAALNVTNYVAMDGEARILLDYVRPPSLSPLNAPPLFAFDGNLHPNRLPWQQLPGNIGVTINLAVSREMQGKDITIPPVNATTLPSQSVTPVTVTPRNLGTLPP